jgi:hypothetical protein
MQRNKNRMKDLAESSNEGCGSKMAALPMMMMISCGQVGNA